MRDSRQAAGGSRGPNGSLGVMGDGHETVHLMLARYAYDRVDNHTLIVHTGGVGDGGRHPPSQHHP